VHTRHPAWRACPDAPFGAHSRPSPAQPSPTTISLSRPVADFGSP